MTAPPPPVADIESRLDDAMRRAAIASADVAGLEVAAADMKDPAVAGEPPAAELPPELMQRLSIDWTGPVGPLVQAVAEQVGYGYVETGPEPAAAFMLTIRRRDEQAWRILRDAGLAVTTRATIVLDAERKIVELRWPEISA